MSKTGKLFRFIKETIEARGESPTVEEMKNALGTNSNSSLQRNLELLEIEGLIRRGKGWRAITLESQDDSNETRIPLLGWVAAGNPIEAILVPEYISVPKEMISPRNKYFALRVRGESMIDENIIDRDVIILRSVSRPDNGQIVVALIDGHDATVKTFRQNGKIVELIPANNKYETIRVESVRVTVQGVLVGLIRQY